MAATRSELYGTFASNCQAAGLDADLSGHDYIVNNLRFTLDREPDNAKAASMLPGMEKQDTNGRW